MLTYLTTYLNNLLRNKEGATAIEYGLLAALIAVAIIATVAAVGTALNATFAEVETGRRPGLDPDLVVLTDLYGTPTTPLIPERSLLVTRGCRERVGRSTRAAREAPSWQRPLTNAGRRWIWRRTARSW